jgi:hypothetical protein
MKFIMILGGYIVSNHYEKHHNYFILEVPLWRGIEFPIRYKRNHRHFWVGVYILQLQIPSGILIILTLLKDANSIVNENNIGASKLRNYF